MRDVYFKQGAPSTYSSSLFTIVVVEYHGSSTGTVITAFNNKKIKGVNEDDKIYDKKSKL